MYFCASLLQVGSCLVTSNDDGDVYYHHDDDDLDHCDYPWLYPDEYNDPHHAWFRFLWPCT